MRKLYLLSVLMCSFLGGAQVAWAGNFPWDQGHDTFVQNSPNDPESNRSNCTAQMVGSPVFLRTGNLFWKETDIELKGRPAMELVRTFNSRDHKDGMFGPGWTGSCQPTLVRTLDWEERQLNSFSQVYKWALRTPDGRRFEFTQRSGETIVPPASLLSTITALSNGGARLTERDGSYHEFNAQGQLTSKADRNGNAITYTYTNGRLVRMADGNGRSLDIVYNSAGRVGSITDHAARVWLYAYNTDGTLESITNPSGGIRYYQYQNFQAAGDGQVYSQLTRITDESGVVVLQVTYDTQGRVASYTEGANTFTYTRNTANTQITKRDSRSSTWVFTVNERGLYTNIRDPLSNNESYTYNEQDRITSYTDKEGLTTTYSYDNQHRPIAESVDGAVLRYTYAGQSVWPVSITSPMGLQTSIQYDARGNPTQIDDPKSGVTRYTWSSRGDLLSQTDANNSTWTATYNSHGLITRITNPLGMREQYQYDSRGNLVRHTNGAGDVTEYEYDLLDRAISMTDPMGASTTFDYDATGRLLRLQTDNGGVVSYSYDQFGRLASYTHFDGGVETYTYLADNNISSIRTPSGATRSYTYDAAKRFTRLTTSGVSNSYAYNRRGQMLTASNGTGSIALAYDAEGRLVSETTNGETITYAYDQDDRLLGWVGLGDSVSYAYSSRGLLSHIGTPAGNIPVTTDPLGRLQQLDLPNGLNVNLAYDAVARVAQIAHGNLPNAQFSYQYDAANRITRWAGDGLDKQFQYDRAGRVTQSTGVQLENFSYDSLGNRLNDNAEFDLSNRLLEDSNYTYQYDANGNRTLKQNKVTGAREIYTYNGLNQLARYQRFPAATGTTTERNTTYTYDALGRRWSKTDNVNGRTDFLWAGARLAGERRGTEITKVYSGHYVRDGSAYYFVHHDHLGTPQLLTDSAGQSVWTADHLVFGALSNESNFIEYNIRFPGQYYDQESGLHYNYFRDYDPSIGRYVQSDPIGFGGGFNTYIYVKGNPLSWVDPAGLATLVPGSPGDINPGDHSGGLDTLDGWIRQPCLVRCNDGSTTEFPHSPDVYDWLLDTNENGLTIEQEIERQRENGWDDDTLQNQFCP